jgi:hypothetical protein
VAEEESIIITGVRSDWDGYPPDRTDGKFHWMRVSPVVTDVMRWEDGRWVSTRFGDCVPPSHARLWTYIGPLREPS